MLLLLQHLAVLTAVISGSGPGYVCAPIPYQAAEFILYSG